MTAPLALEVRGLTKSYGARRPCVAWTWKCARARSSDFSAPGVSPPAATRTVYPLSVAWQGNAGRKTKPRPRSAAVNRHEYIPGKRKSPGSDVATGTAWCPLTFREVRGSLAAADRVASKIWPENRGAPEGCRAVEGARSKPRRQRCRRGPFGVTAGRSTPAETRTIYRCRAPGKGNQ
jgi:hypothetical protein